MQIVMLLLFLALPVLLSWPLGRFMTAVMNPSNTSGDGRMSILIGTIGGRMLEREEEWKGYLLSMLIFNAVMFGAVLLMLSLQHLLPLNPDGKGALEASLIFNTAVSFVTNTNLQHYSGEVSMSYFSQLFALTWLQFVSAATGISCFTALARALGGNKLVGNFYRDLLRSTLFILLPLSVIVALLLVVGGVPMTYEGAAAAQTLEGAMQTISRGPVAAMVAIKQLGTNGGGFFGPNSTHPFENPSFLTNYIECISIPLIAMATVWMFGRITGRMRHAAVIFSVMLLLLVVKSVIALTLESSPSMAFSGLPIESISNLEGKELRFGSGSAALWAAVTTATSNGSVNSMHDSLNPLTGMVPLAGMWLNVIFGGVGVGFINMFIFIIVGVFICGMMVGRTPEYCARKVETHEMKLALLALLVHPLLILVGTAVFASTPWGSATVLNKGAHGFTEILYEFSSAAANNGSGFEGLGDNTVPWNVATGLVMLLGRYIPIILPLAIAGSMAAKKPVPETTGTLRIDTPLFAVVILGSVLLIGALLFMPVAVLGPVADYLSTAIQ
ncbi:potassium-transporting ATPase subunit KdpA [Chlorobium ferrooxidans]|uniref:Potassium-transporting ATPase potassium-binding subunit n=1 Tax=Chlorobium ferrooxidans DSM 13031 TaxID=377431 RepID=Q0YPF1_9CHLB|nr:potassium-transporting ATPase subunit KdpA [Chlorobium ferrooxidans]EAT58178.1 potassium-transporting ATPase, A subunit [Chlorobium ferrooxidans DSM 13031]